MPSYELVRTSGRAGELHELDLPDPIIPTVWLHDISAPALVLGSTMDVSVVDHAACERSGIDVVRRRSGGGAVLLVPGECTWIDVVVPAGAPGWSDDIHAPMVWLGRHIADVLTTANESDEVSHVRFDVHEGALLNTAWSRLVCFDGVGAGEVLANGLKLVGISQRRTRGAARLQVSWHSVYDPVALARLLQSEHRPPPDDLRAVATLASPLGALIPQRLTNALG